MRIREADSPFKLYSKDSPLKSIFPLTEGVLPLLPFCRGQTIRITATTLTVCNLLLSPRAIQTRSR